MKKLTLSLIAAVAAVLSATAQKSEAGPLRLELTAGIFSVNDEYIVNFEQTDEFYVESDMPWAISDNSTIPVFLDLSFFRYHKIEIGVGFGYQHLYTKKGIIDRSLPADASNYEDVDMTMIMFMPRIRWNWMDSADDKFHLYSGLSFGINFINEEHSVLTTEDVSFKHPTGHLNAIGARFGDRISAFMELGVGARGFFTFGLSARLDKK